jgi:hypothetical protein
MYRDSANVGPEFELRITELTVKAGSRSASFCTRRSPCELELLSHKFWTEEVDKFGSNASTCCALSQTPYRPGRFLHGGWPFEPRLFHFLVMPTLVLAAYRERHNQRQPSSDEPPETT